MLIQVISREGRALEVPLTARFGEGGGDIGRGADCTLALPDPQRRLSRKHLVLIWRDGRHFVRHVGANHDVVIDGEPLAPGAEMPLPTGAKLDVGPYRLMVSGDGEGPRAPAPAAVARPSVFSDVLQAAPSSRGEADIDLLVGEPVDPVSATDALRSLYAGLGLPAPDHTSPEHWQQVGRLLRAALGGTMDLLAARHLMKRELGADQTQVRSLANNALKFAPDLDGALAQLLGPSRWGFLEPVAAVDDAFKDLRLHELAVMAGMRAALHALLARFDPDALEQRLVPQALLDTVLPSHRRARLWDDYRAQYAQILREVQDDFDSLFARSFVEAYEKQLAQRAPEADP